MKPQNNIEINIALAGNPNNGKSSLFNCLTGMNTHTGNFPGITTEKQTGYSKLNPSVKAQIVDLPGMYSLYPRREDEEASFNLMLKNDPSFIPDIVLVLIDACNLKRNLLLVTQIQSLGYKVIGCLTMMDIAQKRQIFIDIEKLSLTLELPIVIINPRTKKGIDTLKKKILQILDQPTPKISFIGDYENEPIITALRPFVDKQISNYFLAQQIIYTDQLKLETLYKQRILESKQEYAFNMTQFQGKDILSRYEYIKQTITASVREVTIEQKQHFSDTMDKWLVHLFWGNLVLLITLFICFQSIFWLAAYPMDWISNFFDVVKNYMTESLPNVWWTNLLINGIWSGLGSVFIFVPQIMILFGLITMLEDSGYMARISFLTDRWMRIVGLNGKSVVPLISGFSCAVPAIMSARTIDNKKEKLLTIFIIPFMSCSARLPVYTMLISLVIPNAYFFNIISLQGLVLLIMYIFGIFIALLVAVVAQSFIKTKDKSIFLLEMPIYRIPQGMAIWKNMLSRGKIFLVNVGKIILILSLVIWALSYFGHQQKLSEIETYYNQQIALLPEQKNQLEVM
ncbi:MAG: ferrous iron transport protein B, partial [Chitinophagaceae bacterium]